MKTFLWNNPALLGVGLVLANCVGSWVLGLALGGFKIGRLQRRIELRVRRFDLPGFLLRLQQRTTELGFKPDPVVGGGQYLQGGKSGEDLAQFTHARTLKQLNVAVGETASDEVPVTLKLCYLNPIIGDTGESTYRDAVLDYLTGAADVMRVVPNRSFAAFTTFIGGVFAWGALFALRAMEFPPLAPVLVLTITGMLVGIQAIVAIRKRPGELTGLGLAIAGILGNALALALTAVMAFQEMF